MWFLEIGGKGLEKLMVCKYEPLDVSRHAVESQYHFDIGLILTFFLLYSFQEDIRTLRFRIPGRRVSVYAVESQCHLPTTLNVSSLFSPYSYKIICC